MLIPDVFVWKLRPDNFTASIFDFEKINYVFVIKGG